MRAVLLSEVLRVWGRRPTLAVETKLGVCENKDWAGGPHKGGDA